MTFLQARANITMDNLLSCRLRYPSRHLFICNIQNGRTRRDCADSARGKFLAGVEILVKAGFDQLWRPGWAKFRSCIKSWLSVVAGFLSAGFYMPLNYCMVLLGPEAQQLATYIGWLMHRTFGWALLLGALFVLAVAIHPDYFIGIYLVYGDVPLVAGIFMSTTRRCGDCLSAGAPYRWAKVLKIKACGQLPAHHLSPFCL